MNNLARAKGLADIRTVTTHHIPSKPPKKGTTYLDVFVLSMEKQRLEQELAGIERRRKHTSQRLSEVQEAIDKLLNAGQQEKAAQGSLSSGTGQALASERPKGQPWKKMAIDY